MCLTSNMRSLVECCSLLIFNSEYCRVECSCYVNKFKSAVIDWTEKANLLVTFITFITYLWRWSSGAHYCGYLGNKISCFGKLVKWILRMILGVFHQFLWLVTSTERSWRIERRQRPSHDATTSQKRTNNGKYNVLNKFWNAIEIYKCPENKRQSMIY